jgi:hypothetical protein
MSVLPEVNIIAEKYSPFHKPGLLRELTDNAYSNPKTTTTIKQHRKKRVNERP